MQNDKISATFSNDTVFKTLFSPPPISFFGVEGSLGRDRKRYRYFTLHGILNTTGVWEWGGGLTIRSAL